MALTKAHPRMISGSYASVLDFGATGDGTKDNNTAYSALQAQSMSFLRTTITYKAQ